MQKRVLELEAKVAFLEHQLHNDRPYLQIYRLGAGSFLLAAISLLVWAFTGVAVPFNPAFASIVIPTSIGVMAMAFLVRREEKKAVR